jgi:hypothetical protein
MRENVLTVLETSSFRIVVVWVMATRCLKMFSACFKATLVTSYETTHHNSEDHDAFLHCHENFFFFSVGALGAFVS